MDVLQSINETVQHMASEQERMIQGLRSMVNSAAIDSEMLAKILRAVTEPAPDTSPLTDFLARLIVVGEANQALLQQIAARMNRIEVGIQSLRR